MNNVILLKISLYNMCKVKDLKNVVLKLHSKLMHKLIIAQYVLSVLGKRQTVSDIKINTIEEKVCASLGCFSGRPEIVPFPMKSEQVFNYLTGKPEKFRPRLQNKAVTDPNF